MARLATSYAQDEYPFGLRRPVLQPSGGPSVVPPPPEELPPPAVSDVSTPTTNGVVMSEGPVQRSPEEAQKILDAALQRHEETLKDPAFAQYIAPQPNKGARVLDAIFSGLAGQNYNAGYWDQRDQAAQQEELKNPQSAQSVALRKAHGPMLKQLGFADDEIAHLSGADITQMTKGGNLVENLMRGRQAAAQAKAAEAKLQEGRAYEEKKATEARAYNEQKSAEQRKYEEEQAAGPKFERQLAIAREQSGLSASRAANQAVLSSDLSRQNAAAEQAAREAAATEAERRKAEQSEADEAVSLDRLQKQLEKRDPSARLPGSQGALDQGVLAVRGAVEGPGAGYSPEDASLHTDLTSLGLQSYMNKAHNAPNSEREQQVANQMFRGNGTVGSALQRVRQRRAEIEATRKARAKSAKKPLPFHDDDLGVTYDRGHL